MWVAFMMAGLLVLTLTVCSIGMTLTYQENVRACAGQGGHLERDRCVVP